MINIASIFIESLQSRHHNFLNVSFLMSIFKNLLSSSSNLASSKELIGAKEQEEPASFAGVKVGAVGGHDWTFDATVDPKTIFTKLKVLGKGGFGTVLQIVHRPTMKVLAGKLINPNLVDENSKAELQKEIQLMQAVDSDYTVHYYGSILFEGSLMILMEYCDRGSLRDLLDAREQVLSEDQISIVLHDLLKGLQIIHKRNRIVHRDIKAANILITTDCEIKIADFGVSRQFDSGACQTMTITGTPYWMAPEVISGTYYSFPADIWSVGITAVELAEGAPPYIEFSPTKAMIEIAIKGFPGYRFPTMHSPDFTDFVSKCLIVNQNERWNVDQLLQHPFIMRAERIPRAQVLRDLLKPTKSRGRRDSMDYSSLSRNNPISGLPDAMPDIPSFMMDPNGNADLPGSYAANVNLPTGTNFAQGFDGNSFSGMAMLMSQQFNPNSFRLAPGDSLNSMNLPFMAGSNAFDSLKFASFKPGGELVLSNEPDQSGTPFDSLTADSSFVAANQDSQTFKSFTEQIQEQQRQYQKQQEVLRQQQQVQYSSINPNVAGGVSDFVFVKTARALGQKIPFISMKPNINNTIDVKTLYKTAKDMNASDFKEEPLFDEEGVLNVSRALREKRVPQYFAIFLIIFMFLTYGKYGFVLLATFSFLVNLLVIYYRKKRKQLFKQIEEGTDDGPIN